LLALLTCVCLPPAALAAQTTDRPGSSDHRLFPRISGYVIYAHRDEDPVMEQFRNGQGSARDTIEGRVTRIDYTLPTGSTQPPTPPLGLVRHYEGIVQQLGGTILYRQPTFGELTARLVQNGREFWIYVHAENREQYGVLIAERSAPVRAGAIALGGSNGAGSCPCTGQGPSGPAQAAGATLLPGSARLFAAAAARFALDTGWVPVVQPSRATSNTVVLIRGAHVEDATEVRFGDTPAVIRSRGASELMVVVPVRPVGLVPVVVSGPAGARTARDSFQIYQNPIDDNVNDLRVYTCTNPQHPDAPRATTLVPTAVRRGDTLVIDGTRLDEVEWVSFTYQVNPDFPDWLRRDDRNWGEANPLGILPPGVPREDVSVWPVTQSATRLRVVVPRRARTGPVALFGGGDCVVSDQSVGVRTGPAPR